MTDILQLDPSWIICPGSRNIERTLRSHLARIAYERAETKRLRTARLAFEVAMMRGE